MLDAKKETVRSMCPEGYRVIRPSGYRQKMLVRCQVITSRSQVIACQEVQ